MHDDYIKLCRQGMFMAKQTKTWMTNFLFKEFLFFFKRLVLNGISLTNKQLFILNGHGSHVALKAIEQA